MASIHVRPRSGGRSSELRVKHRLLSRLWEFCWVDCTIRALDSDIEDIFDQNATPELCTWFACDWANNGWDT